MSRAIALDEQRHPSVELDSATELLATTMELVIESASRRDDFIHPLADVIALN